MSNIYKLKAPSSEKRTIGAFRDAEQGIDPSQVADAILYRNAARYRFICDNPAFIPRGLFDDIEAYGLFLDRGMAALAVYERAIGRPSEAFPLLNLNGTVQGYKCSPRTV